MEFAASVADRLEAVRARIRAAAERSGRRFTDVTLVAVSKNVPAEGIRAVARLGVVDVGESRVQEALPKIEAVADPAIRWHLVGHLQRNKARRAAELFTLIHSVDTEALAEALAHGAETQGRVVSVLLQVNVAGEPGKHGCATAEVIPMARRMRRLAALRLEGLMTIAPLADDPGDARPVFQQLRRLGEALREEAPEARHLSMGMSDDFEVAIEEGATLIRVGRALFGDRPA